MLRRHLAGVARTRRASLTALLSLTLAALFAAPLSFLFAANSTPRGQKSRGEPSVAQSARSGNPLQAETRLVTVDVVVTDSHGNPIRGLQADDFEVSDGGHQKVEKFAFIDGSISATSTRHTAPAGSSYSNQIEVDTLASPPTVILIDSLNTATSDLAQTKRHMLDLLKTLPNDTPVAVLLLGSSLHLVQNFTTNPSLLRAAIDGSSRAPSAIAPMPQDDPNSLSLLQTEMNGGEEDDDIQLLEDFEKETYANQMDIRVTTTINALRAVAGFLRGYPGRKNLIWVSESFPLALWPDYDFGTNTNSQFRNTFAGTRAYSDQIQGAANALTDARVAIYPVDARGLDTNVSPSPQVVSVPVSASRNPAAQIRRINMARMMAQTTMDQLAETTGGRTCKNTNDLSGCVESAVHDGSSYYELAYSPEGIKWDGSFRKISVRVHRSGARLAYRRGYYAQDASQAAKQSPELRLRQACEDFLPSTAIPISAKPVAPDRTGDASYRISIPARALTVSQEGDSYRLSAMLVSCVFPRTGKSFTMVTHDLSQNMSGSRYADFQTNGLQGPADYSLQGAVHFRIAVLDEASGQVGALDIPVRSADLTALVPAPTAIPSEPDSPSSPQLSTSIGFRLPTGESADLDWTGGKLVYTGNIAVEKSAPGLFQQFYTSKGFHCSSGALTPDDPTATAPTLRLTFIDSTGASSIVDLKGEQPEYSGTLPVDESAKPLFQRLWYLVHCQAAH